MTLQILQISPLVSGRLTRDWSETDPVQKNEL
jgi:hypothetical protein